MILVEMVELERAVNEESWEWLWDTYPALAAALQVEVRRGRTAEEVRRWALRYTGRPALALRLEQAAGHLGVTSGE
jgi:hypothetical protein